MEYEISIDPKVICRVCLAENTLKTLFCNEIVNGSILPFPKVFECVTGLKVETNILYILMVIETLFAFVGYKAVKDDGFPDKLCPGCRSTITESYVLQQKSKSNQTLLSGILNIPLVETDDRKHKVTVVASTQTDEEIRTKAENVSTQTTQQDTFSSCTQTTLLDTFSSCTQTTSVESKTIRTQTDTIVATEEKVSKSTAECQTDTIDTTEGKVLQITAECQTEPWSPVARQLQEEMVIETITEDPSHSDDEILLEELQRVLVDNSDEEEEAGEKNIILIDAEESIISEQFDDIGLDEESSHLEVEQSDEKLLQDSAEYLIEDDEISEVTTRSHVADASNLLCSYCNIWFDTIYELTLHMDGGCGKPKRKKRPYNR